MDTLTAHEDRLVREFVSITSYPAPPHTAIPYLQASDWNLERAIIMYFESTPAANEQLNSSARRVTQSETPGAFPGDDSLSSAGQHPPQGQQQQQQRGGTLSQMYDTLRSKLTTLLGNSQQYLPLTNDPHTPSTATFLQLTPKSKFVYITQLVLYVPLYVLHKLTLVTLLILSKLFPFFKRLTDRYSQNRHGSRSEPKGVDPAQIARNFISDFNTFYRRDSPLEFFEGGYATALYLVKRDARFMAVYLHSEENDDTNQFVNETLLDDRVLKFFKDHNILVWGGNVAESEAFQVSNVLNATRYPFIALVSWKSETRETPEGTTTGTPVVSVVSRVQGPISPEKLVDKFSSQVERLEPTLIAMRAERQQQALDRVIREQQDQAYNLSLQRDRQAAEQRRLERLRAEKKEQWVKWRVSTLLPEPSQELRGEYARVAIRLSNGERISRRFSQDCPLEEIYAYVEFHQLIGSVSGQVEKPDGFDYEYPFKLISPMPRVELPPSLDVQVKDEPVVWPNGNLIVEMNE